MQDGKKLTFRRRSSNAMNAIKMFCIKGLETSEGYDLYKDVKSISILNQISIKEYNKTMKESKKNLSETMHYARKKHFTECVSRYDGDRNFIGWFWRDKKGVEHKLEEDQIIFD